MTGVQGFLYIVIQTTLRWPRGDYRLPEGGRLRHFALASYSVFVDAYHEAIGVGEIGGVADGRDKEFGHGYLAPAFMALARTSSRLGTVMTGHCGRGALCFLDAGVDAGFVAMSDGPVVVVFAEQLRVPAEALLVEVGGFLRIGNVELDVAYECQDCSPFTGAACCARTVESKWSAFFD
jgi:hypothetical protein